MITKLIFADGTEISSGTVPAVMSFSMTGSVSNTQELNPGACCCTMVQLAIYGLQELPQGEFRILRTDGEHTRDLGLFIPQLPERSGSILKITAYDRLCLLDKPVALSLPCSLYELSKAVCQSCGLELHNEQIPSGDYVVKPFATAGVTGRQLLQWVAALSGGFWRTTVEGKAELAWYTPRDISLTASDYYENSLSLAAFDAQPIRKVVLKQTAEDVGVVWPNLTGGACYESVGNPLLNSGEVTLAQTLFDRIGNLVYTPCQVTLPERDIRPGDLITVEGKTVAVMTTRLQNGRLTVEATGSAARDSSQAVNELSYKGINGRVLELSTKVDGLRVENKDQAGLLARLELSVEGLQSTVSSQTGDTDKRLTELEQTADALAFRVEQTAGEVVTSTGYTFNADGLTIAKAGTQMENRLDHTGMYVQRAGQTILQANNKGVQARDVTVENYLHIGSARFEEYGARTACFYVE